MRCISINIFFFKCRTAQAETKQPFKQAINKNLKTPVSIHISTGKVIMKYGDLSFFVIIDPPESQGQQLFPTFILTYVKEISSWNLCAKNEEKKNGLMSFKVKVKQPF